MTNTEIHDHLVLIELLSDPEITRFDTIDKCQDTLKQIHDETCKFRTDFRIAHVIPEILAKVNEVENPPAKMIHDVPCPICGEYDILFFKQGKDRPQTYNIVCTHCGSWVDTGRETLKEAMEG